MNLIDWPRPEQKSQVESNQCSRPLASIFGFNLCWACLYHALAARILFTLHTHRVAASITVYLECSNTSINYVQYQTLRFPIDNSIECELKSTNNHPFSSSFTFPMQSFHLLRHLLALFRHESGVESGKPS